MRLVQFFFDWLPDVAGILLAAVSVALIFIPKELKVLEQPKWKWPRRVLAVVLALVGAGGLVSSELQKAADKTERQKLEQNVDRLEDDIAEVQKKVSQNQNASVTLIRLVPLNDAQEIGSEDPVSFNVAYGVLANTAKSLRHADRLYLEDNPPNGTKDKEVWKKFKSLALEKMGDKGQDYAVGNYSWSTVEGRLTDKQAKAVLHGTQTIYFLGLVQWNNPSGTEGHLDACLYLQKPTSKLLTPMNTVWHECTL